MPPALRTFLLSLRDLALTAGPLALLAVGLLVGAYVMLKPTPPTQVELATGLEQGAYDNFGRLYADHLRANGISVNLRRTAGAAENLALLRDPDSGVDLAFVQGGTAGDAATTAQATQDDDLVSLGSVFFEPVWLFYREDSARRLIKQPLKSLTQLVGWRVNVGAPGSGLPPLLLQVLDANRIEPARIKLSQLELTPAVVEFLEGRLDALVLASAPESLMVQMLLQTPGIRLFDFAQAEAYTRRFPFMSAVTLPRGVVDLARDVPPQDVRLIAPTALLLARRSLHPALAQLFVQAATQVHGAPGWFQRKSEFPNARNTEWPLASEAQRYYRSGAPWLQRYLPFWLANLIDRMWIVVLSLIAVLIPLARVVPPLYELRVRSRVYRWYGQLRKVEHAQASIPRAELLQQLDEIESKVHQVHVPLSHADELYALRSYIQMVRQRLQEAAGHAADGIEAPSEATQPRVRPARSG